ncbi:hypothetical protein [Actinomadura sediminis]|uniref:Tyr recombinase domain-containing protein n=1 Tax=Actinomadura sediminis TaxID=1038904 RepID=A0ABW3EHQ4_9ACTN
MLYETAARAAETLSLDVQNLENRRVPLKSKGGDIEWVYWDAGTARLSSAPTGRCSCPTAGPSPHAVRAQSSSARTSDGSDSATTAPASISGCSQ